MKPIINDNILRDAVVKELESDLEVAAKHISAVRQLTGVRAVGNLIEVKSEAGPPPRGRRRQPSLR
jgi:hypothetical protein